MRFFHTALNLKRKDRRPAIREIFLIQGMIGMVGQGRMIDLLHLRMAFQKRYHLLRVFGMPFQTKRQRFYPLQKQESRKGRDGRPCITKQNRPNIRYKCRRTHCFDKRYAVITGVGFGNGRISAGCRPVKLTGIHNDTAKGCAMTAQKLGGRMYHNIRTVFNRAQQIRRTESIVHH